MPADRINDEDPRYTAKLAWEALLDVIRRHPDVTNHDADTHLYPTMHILRRLAGEKKDG
jgi:hypothetical protein